MRELPVAQLTALMANVNRDPSKGKEFRTQDFCLFRDDGKGSSDRVFSAAVAAVALELRHQQRAPDLLLTVWPQVLASATKDGRVPPVRALRSADDAVWVLAPRWEGRNIRGGLVLVRGQICGTVHLRDLDRPMMSYAVSMPPRNGYGWIEAETLLQAADAAT